ncbi:procollagen-lysine,2-oxoglutarate 5-dioxygenase 2 [Platysternon megacephalum]|uniref:Procollagen-lysine,2-oxoglutarate 5-dioxygenase 2 n=1 Tax=Platysternon megacephalum TaxID=55544 RepID=A0A4D9ECS2_9SAUR|nr:procollagen-lysine,2-oxoglutarate 5-dioxygenase 2 [Platysternon megacephalum]
MEGRCCRLREGGGGAGTMGQGTGPGLNMLVTPTPTQIDFALFTKFFPPHFVFLRRPTQGRGEATCLKLKELFNVMDCQLCCQPQRVPSAPLCSEELLDKTAPEPPRRFTTAVTYQLVIYKGCFSCFSSISG